MMHFPILKLARDERGTSIIEMALVAPVLATMFVGMVDLSNAYSMKLELEQAAQRSIEKVMQYRTQYSTYDTLQTEAATAAGVATSAVTVTYWHECDGAKQASYNTVCATGATETRYIEVSINKDFTPSFGTRFLPGAVDGKLTLNGKAGLRTQ
jgi:Flp pilus assembly protein TadG